MIISISISISSSSSSSSSSSICTIIISKIVISKQPICYQQKHDLMTKQICAHLCMNKVSTEPIEQCYYIMRTSVTQILH